MPTYPKRGLVVIWLKSMRRRYVCTSINSGSFWRTWCISSPHERILNVSSLTDFLVKVDVSMLEGEHHT
ncbi:hypothetical protein [Methanobacterium formicicum]|uniref:hypothetical protein n=1 Tax=Methanobacterium formicicum TaxID=2162 RepID=UPI0012FDA83E|nr:hypothetical protein [Methanobacterium formicicum]